MAGLSVLVGIGCFIGVGLVGQAGKELWFLGLLLLLGLVGSVVFLWQSIFGEFRLEADTASRPTTASVGDENEWDVPAEQPVEDQAPPTDVLPKDESREGVKIARRLVEGLRAAHPDLDFSDADAVLAAPWGQDVLAAEPLAIVTKIPGTLLGTDESKSWCLLPAPARVRHIYVVGRTGSGKSTLLQHMIQQDIYQGRGAVAVMAPEGEFFRDQILPLIPQSIAADVIYFAPGDPKCPVVFNPLACDEDEDPGLVANELFSILKRAIGDHEEFGPRMTPILRNALMVFVGRPGATLLDVRRFIDRDDPSAAAFRAEVARTIPDAYLRDFWLSTYERYPKGADIPIINRLDQFLAPPAVRRALCTPGLSVSIRKAVAQKKILLLDLSRLAPDDMQLLGQMLLASIQIEVMRREEIRLDERTPFFLYADEFQTFAGTAEGTWRELLSRGRKFGIGLTLAHQHPSQLPPGVQGEIIGNVATIVAFSLSAHDAQTLHSEFRSRRRVQLQPGPMSHADYMRLSTSGQLAAYLTGQLYETSTLDASNFMDLQPGTMITKLDGGYAKTLRGAPPIPCTAGHGEEMKKTSWAEYERHIREQERLWREAHEGDGGPKRTPDSRTVEKDVSKDKATDFLE
jgi:hypothetical protein